MIPVPACPKPVIQLWDSVGLGVIIRCESGVVITNQTGGTHCLHPGAEGVFVPLRNDCLLKDHIFISPEHDLTAWFVGPKHRGAGATSGLDAEDADFIDGLLQRNRLHPAIQVDRSHLEESHEAWVHVLITEDEHGDADLAIFANFGPYPRQGILTWCNSD